MSLSQPQALSNQFLTSLEVREPNLRPGLELAPVTTLQRRTRQHYVASLADPVVDRPAKTLQPGLAIGVAEWDAVPNLFYVRGWMKIVCVGELPFQLRGQRAPDGRLARADDSHHNYDHGWRAL